MLSRSGQKDQRPHDCSKTALRNLCDEEEIEQLTLRSGKDMLPARSLDVQSRNVKERTSLTAESLKIILVQTTVSRGPRYREKSPVAGSIGSISAPVVGDLSQKNSPCTDIMRDIIERLCDHQASKCLRSLFEVIYQTELWIHTFFSFLPPHHVLAD